jgi:hypothetical protein
VGNNAIGLKSNDLFCELVHLLGAVVAKTVTDPNIPSGGPPPLIKPCLEGLCPLLHLGIVG